MLVVQFGCCSVRVINGKEGVLLGSGMRQTPFLYAVCTLHQQCLPCRYLICYINNITRQLLPLITDNSAFDQPCQPHQLCDSRPPPTNALKTHNPLTRTPPPPPTTTTTPPYRDREPVAGPAALSRSGEVRLHPDTHRATAAAGGGTPPGRRGSVDSPAAKAAAAASLRRSSTDSAARQQAPASPAATTSPGHQGGDAEGYRTPPAARRLSRDAPATTPELRTATPPDGSCKRVSTSSKLHNIFSRGSVQHPVATLAAEGSGTTDSATAADQDV